MKTNHGTPRVDWFLNCGEDEGGEAWWLGTKASTAAIDQDTPDVPPRAHVGEERHDADSERVEQPVGHEDTGVHDEDPAQRVGEVRRHVEERGEEEGEAVVDSSRDGDLAEKVEPAGEPAPRARIVLGELARPEVQSACGRVRRRDLGHPEPDDERHRPDDEPAPDDDHRAAVGHPEEVEREAPREHRDDGEGHGEVREPAHPPAQLLRVAECVQLGDVVAHRLRAAAQPFRRSGHWSSPSGAARAALRSRPEIAAGSTHVSSICARAPPPGAKKRHPLAVPLSRFPPVPERTSPTRQDI